MVKFTKFAIVWAPQSFGLRNSHWKSTQCCPRCDRFAISLIFYTSTINNVHGCASLLRFCHLRYICLRLCTNYLAVWTLYYSPVKFLKLERHELYHSQDNHRQREASAVVTYAVQVERSWTSIDIWLAQRWYHWLYGAMKLYSVAFRKWDFMTSYHLPYYKACFIVGCNTITIATGAAISRTNLNFRFDKKSLCCDYSAALVPE